MMPARFVILHHRLADGEHWDLMLEQGDVLLTWQLFREPAGPAALPIPARRIGDHRKAYLEYEGPVSGDRGTVRRVDAGSFEFISQGPNVCDVIVRGLRFNGSFRLQKTHGDDWELRPFSGS